ncbi:porin [Bacteroides sp.]|uniref:OprO/OprP family phosphate-selective porin n=1 Tax=Bacteroides sp. TaxID=29523 RepID=UPI0025B7FE43|nr:porin [Bacteroides sp.]
MKKHLLILFTFLCTVPSVLAGNETGESPSKTSKWHLSYDNKYHVKFFGRISADGGIFWGEKDQKMANGTTISQLAFGGTFFFGERLSGKFEIDFSNGNLLLLDNFITYNFTKRFGLRAGNIQEAFSMDLLNSFKDLSLMNRAQVVNAFAPGHHLGLQGVYEDKQWLLTGGVHFQKSMTLGNKENSDSNLQKGQNEGYSLTGRAVWMPQNNSKEKGLHIGVAASYATPKTDVGKDTPPKTVRYSQSESTINKIKFMDTGYITDVNDTRLMGVELAGYYGPWKFQAEYIQQDVNRNHGFVDESFSGFYVQSSCLLLGGKQDYNNSRGAFNQPLIGKKGDIELALRFDRLDMNGKVIKGGVSNQYTAGMNYYINENLKVQLNYYYITHKDYNSLNVRVQLRF